MAPRKQGAPLKVTPSPRQPATKARSLDLGQLQNEVEQASRHLKATNTSLKKAIEAQESAEANHVAAQKALAAGVAQLTAATKVV